MERERILLQYFWEFIADPATSGSRKQRLKLAEFDWIKKVKEITPLTKGMSGRELSNMMLGIQVRISVFTFNTFITLLDKFYS